MGNEEQRDDGKELDLEMADISGSRSSFVPIGDSDSSDAKRLGSNEAAERTASPSSTKRRSTGPRTIAGKTRSSQNSSKHRIFSKVVLLKDEPRDEFESLLNGLRNDLQPIGTLETVLVDKLAALLWRQRRLLIAEGAEIRKGREFVEWDEERANEGAAARISSFTLNLNGGLVREIANPNVLQRCLDLLEDLKSGIERDGFEIECDKQILTTLYGEYRKEEWRDTLFCSYLYWLVKSECPDKTVPKQDRASSEECKEQFLQELDREIRRLDRHKKGRASTESARMKLVSLSRSIPDAVHLDHLLRYEVTLDRETDRLLRRLERLQRMRLGQPLPPPIDVSVSLDG